MLTSAVDAFSGNASNALTGLITGTMSAQDAMRSLGNTMLNSVVNALVRLGLRLSKTSLSVRHWAQRLLLPVRRKP